MNRIVDLESMIKLSKDVLLDFELSYQLGDTSDDLIQKYNKIQFAIDDATVLLARACLDVFVQVPAEIRNIDTRRIFSHDIA